MEPPSSGGRLWPAFAAFTMAAIAVAAVCWSLAHPYGIHWDEAQYFDDIGIDVQRLRSGFLLRLAGRILLKSAGHPPAFRLLALPILGLFGFSPATARLVSLACFGLSAWFVFLATRRIGTTAAGAFAALVFCLSPEVVSASIFFGTDTSLYLATSAMLYYVFVCWSEGAGRSNHWIGLGLAFGLGFLSKASFVLIALPVLAYWLVVSRDPHLKIPSLVSQRKAGALAFLVAAPWWFLNLKSSIAYAQYARGFVRNSLGPISFQTWMRWLSTVFQCLLGHGLSFLIGLVAAACVFKVVVKKETILDPFEKTALGACACAGLPIVLAQLSGTNHLLRHISPAVIPLAVTVGILADKTGWTRSVPAIAASSILFGVQLLMIVAPVVFPNQQPVDLGFVNGALPWRVMARFDQWNWKPVREMSYSCGVSLPRISFLGSGRTLDPPQIEYPWVAEPTSTRKDGTVDFPDVTWLWRYEDGSLDWRKVMDAAEKSDIVLTAPHYIGEVRNKEDLDNQHNADFAARLSQDPVFRGPIRLEMGRFEPVEVWLFLKQNLKCQ